VVFRSLHPHLTGATDANIRDIAVDGVANGTEDYTAYRVIAYDKTNTNFEGGKRQR
jgi:hypothetical protein